MTDVDTAPTDVFSSVAGQPEVAEQLRRAVAHPVHAFLLVGPRGSGTRAGARALGAALLSADATTPEDAERHQRLALSEHHPDLEVLERVGASISKDAAREIVRRAALSPSEGRRKVMVLVDFHLVSPEAAAVLLKTIEEPPPGRFFAVLADEVTPDLVTIASRCMRIDFPPLTDESVTAALLADGVEPGKAAEVAAASHGDLDRARLLVTDERLALRLQLWRSLPSRIDGTGAVAAGLVDEVRATIDDAAGPLRERHAAEAATLQERIERYGQRGSGARELDERHKREARRLRTDELHLGFAELSRRYRDGLLSAADPRPLVDAIGAIQAATEALIRNPSEELLLQALFLRLPHLL